MNDKGYQGKLTSADEILDNLELYGKEGKNLLKSVKHPTLPYISICYTNECNCSPLFSENWDNITMSCRGIIIDTERRKIVSKPFNKFFNYDPDHHKNKLTQDSYILEKLDGSLGVMYFDPEGNNPRIASKNSFNSEMAIFANQWLDNFIQKNGNIFNSEYTYLFEIIYPENRIVIDYHGRSECVLLAVIDTQTSEEFHYDYLMELHNQYGISIPKLYNFKSFYNIVKHCKDLPWDDEGYVVTLKTENGQFKYKLKSENYKIVHALLFNTTPKSILKMIKEGIDFIEVVKPLPEDCSKPLIDVYNAMINESTNYVRRCEDVFVKIYHKGMSRKEFALEATKNYSDISSGLFILLDHVGLNNYYDKISKQAFKTIDYNKYNISTIKEEKL